MQNSYVLDGIDNRNRIMGFDKSSAQIIRISYSILGQLPNHFKTFQIISKDDGHSSLVIHPASTTHRQLTEAELKAAGVSADMVRLSVSTISISRLSQLPQVNVACLNWPGRTIAAGSGGGFIGHL